MKYTFEDMNMIHTLPKDIVDSLKKCPQDPKFHGEGSVYNHIKLVFDLLEPYDDIDLYLSAIFHDLGKLDTIHVYEKVTGIRIQTIGHESKVDDYIEKYSHLFPYGNWDKVSFICKNHMRAHQYLSGEIKKESKKALFETHEYSKALLQFALADSKGRIENQPTQPYLIITCGIPGSGKSTWRNSFVKDHPEYKSICPDDIRKSITGSISDMSQDSRVWKHAYNSLDYALSNNVNCIFDSTCVNTKTQSAIEKKGKEYNAIILYKIFDVTSHEAKTRIRNDIANSIERSNVPDIIVDRMYSNFSSSIERIATERKKFNVFVIEKDRYK